jgi:hypothetical protein
MGTGFPYGLNIRRTGHESTTRAEWVLVLIIKSTIIMLALIWHSIFTMISYLRNSSPSSSNTLWGLSVGASGDPSLYQWIVGFGLPSDTHRRVAGSLLPTIVSTGCSLIRGARLWALKKYIDRNLKYNYNDDDWWQRRRDKKKSENGRLEIIIIVF